MVSMETLDHQRKNLVLILLKQTQRFVWVCIIMLIMFVNRKEIFQFKNDNKSVNFPTQFCLENISNGFSNTESTEVSLNGNVYVFSVENNCIDKSKMLDIHKE